MNIREALTKKVAGDTDVSVDVVHNIISFQGEDALKNVKIVHELEFSGFGKFLLSQTKLKNKIRILEQAIIKYAGTERAERCQIDLEEFKTKLR